MQLEHILNNGPQGQSELSGVEQLRRAILLDGIPQNSDGMSEFRIYIWLILLNAPPIRTDTYLDLVRQGASPAYAKIRHDTFRTLSSDPLFKRRVSENSITRVLNAMAWKLHDAHEARVNGWMSPPTLGVPRSVDGGDGGGSAFGHSPVSTTGGGGFAPLSLYGPRGSVAGTDAGSEAGDSVFASGPTAGGQVVGYVQGMNVMAAPFLYAARSEPEAFVLFERWVTFECPGYVRGSMDGVHKGLALVEKLLAIVDPKLSAHLAATGMKAEIYAFPSVLTMCACTPPLPEVLKLWDFLLAYGPHLNLLCIVSQLVLMRDALLSNPAPKPDFKPLRAREVIEYTINFARKISDELYEEMLVHAK